MGEGRKPLTISQRPRESSHTATGSAAIRATAETWLEAPKIVAVTEAKSRGAPTRPISGMIAGHEAGAVHQ